MTQTVKVSGIPLNVTSAKLFAVNSDTLIETVSGGAIVRGTNDPSYFEITFDETPGWYRMNLYNGSTLIGQEPQIYLSDSVTIAPIPAPSSPGLCNVRFLALDRATPIPNARVTIELEESNPMVDTALLTRAQAAGVTNPSGYVDLQMVQFASFTRGGIYRARVVDTQGRIIHDRRVKVPSVSSCYAEDLLDA